MNAPLSSLYTNEASPDFLRSQKDYLFSQQLEGTNKDVLRIVGQQRAFADAHRPHLSTVWQPRATSLVMAGGFSVQLRRWSSHGITVKNYVLHVYVDYSKMSQCEELDFKDFIKMVESAAFDLSMREAQVLYINNYKCAHGRPHFTPKYDETDRWLKRVQVSKDVTKHLDREYSLDIITDI